MDHRHGDGLTSLAVRVSQEPCLPQRLRLLSTALQVHHHACLALHGYWDLNSCPHFAWRALSLTRQLEFDTAFLTEFLPPEMLLTKCLPMLKVFILPVLVELLWGRF